MILLQVGKHLRTLQTTSQCFESAASELHPAFSPLVSWFLHYPRFCLTTSYSWCVGVQLLSCLDKDFNTTTQSSSLTSSVRSTSKALNLHVCHHHCSRSAFWDIQSSVCALRTGLHSLIRRLTFTVSYWTASLCGLSTANRRRLLVGITTARTRTAEHIPNRFQYVHV